MKTFVAAQNSGARIVDDAAEAMRVTQVDAAGTTISQPTAAQLGATNESAAASDTATSGLNGLLKRIAQHLTSLIALLGRSSAANVPVIATATGDAIAANASRKSWSLQNVGTTPLFVRLGAGASGTVFHFVLKPGTTDSDGLGALVGDDSYTGVVSVWGTSPKFVVTELT
ncbi:MAG TPA: hypothetical protein VEZ40_06140 [Pyrinomonadaceae bacterium]|nr:hypothetical protein [Pyrinomonadaceae bacterium]